MNLTSQKQYAEILSAAEKIASEYFGSRIRLSGCSVLSEEGRRNTLLRCKVVNDLSVATLIIKKVRSESYGNKKLPQRDIKRLLSDWAGTQFINSLRSDEKIAPQFYGGNLQLGFIVLEDLGPNTTSLVEPLFQQDHVRAQEALFDFAKVLGKLQALTAGKSEIFSKVLHFICPNAIPFNRGFIGIRALYPTLRTLVNVRRSCTNEVRSLVERFNNKSNVAYVHGDPCFSNVLYVNQQPRLIDFEFSQTGQIMTDIVCARMAFPTCAQANRIPKQIVARMETIHRAEIVRGCPELEDERLFETLVVDACGYWLINTLGFHLKKAVGEDSLWGIVSNRSRILSRIVAFIDVSYEYDHLPYLRQMATELLTVLGKNWPNTEALPFFPVFDDS